MYDCVEVFVLHRNTSAIGYTVSTSISDLVLIVLMLKFSYVYTIKTEELELLHLVYTPCYTILNEGER